jgi:hypothetical protein
VAKLGFPVYAGWTRYPVADAKGAVGFATADPAARVVTFYEKATLTPALDERGLRAVEHDDQTEALKLAPKAGDPDLVEQNRLLQEVGKTHDPATRKQLDEIQKRLSERSKQVSAALEKGALELKPQLPARDKTFRVFLVERRGRKLARVVYVYRQEVVGKTIVELVWDPAVYPQAR